MNHRLPVGVLRAWREITFAPMGMDDRHCACHWYLATCSDCLARLLLIVDPNLFGPPGSAVEQRRNTSRW